MMISVSASGASRVQAIGSSLVTQSKVKQLLARACKTKLTSQFP
jgi:hypothetical protein